MNKRLLLPFIIAAPFVYVFFFDLNKVEEESLPVEVTEPEIAVCPAPPEHVPSDFPPHWGEPPSLQLKDFRKLPEPYGYGSSTLAAWITKNQEGDKKNENK